MDLELKDSIIIVTGGAKGIGEAITRTISLEGGIPVIADRDERAGEKLVRELKEKGLKAHFEFAELGEALNCKEVIQKMRTKFGALHGLVNNAGINDGVGLQKGSPEKFEESLKRNLHHYYYMAHYATDALKETKGSIVNICSKVAITGQGGTSGYAAAKGGQLGLTREWAVELAPYSVRVNAILPAEVFTPLYESWLESNFEDPNSKKREIESRIPLDKRMTTSEEIAAMTVFLLSARSSHTTGQLISVDGGYTHLDRAIT